jgi:hypothetical protein
LILELEIIIMIFFIAEKQAEMHRFFFIAHEIRQATYLPPTTNTSCMTI